MLLRPVNVPCRKDAIVAALDHMQSPGTGFNPSLLSVACGLRGAAVGHEHALQMALDRAEDLGVRPNRYWEIVRAFDKAFSAQSKSVVQHTSNHFTQVVRDVAKVEAFTLTGTTADKLRQLSPVPTPDLKTWPVLRKLFPDRKTLICVGEDEASARVVQRDEDLHLDKCQFIVPSPMTKHIGVNQQGEHTPRSLENTGARRFLVVECDFAYYARDGRTHTIWYDTIERLSAAGRTVKDMCASVIIALALSAEAEDLKLALVTFSGKKSLHAWFYVEGRSDEELKTFFTKAISLGADPATWTRSQWVRMPGGTRYTGESDDRLKPLRQEIYYFDPTYATL